MLAGLQVVTGLTRLAYQRAIDFGLFPSLSPRRLVGLRNLAIGASALLRSSLAPSVERNVHTCSALFKSYRVHSEPQQWPKYNDIVYPPRQPGEPQRPAEVVHFRPNVKYSQKKLWYVACLIRGMSVDEALKQLSFYKRHGATIIKEVIEEAQEMALQQHHVEYKSNLWIEDSFVRKAKTLKGMRKHARGRFGIIHYRYSHYFLRLREGRPPKHYYPPRPTGHEMVEGYLERLRERKILQSL